MGAGLLQRGFARLRHSALRSLNGGLVGLETGDGLVAGLLRS